MLTYTQIAFNGAMALLMGLLIGLEREHSIGLEREHSQKDIPLIAGSGLSLSSPYSASSVVWLRKQDGDGCCLSAWREYARLPWRPIW